MLLHTEYRAQSIRNLVQTREALQDTYTRKANAFIRDSDGLAAQLRNILARKEQILEAVEYVEDLERALQDPPEKIKEFYSKRMEESLGLDKAMMPPDNQQLLITVSGRLIYKRNRKAIESSISKTKEQYFSYFHGFFNAVKSIVQDIKSEVSAGMVVKEQAIEMLGALNAVAGTAASNIEQELSREETGRFFAYLEKSDEVGQLFSTMNSYAKVRDLLPGLKARPSVGSSASLRSGASS